jgi:hypothetical protein
MVTIAEDVGDFVSIISPSETPFLDALDQAPRAASNVLHEWLEDALSPNTIVASSNVGSVTGADNIGIAGGAAAFLQVGAILESPITVNGEREKMQITAINGNTIVVARAQGGTAPSSFGAGQSLFVIVDAALEGADVVDDTSRPRLRKNNYVQPIKKDIIISGTSRAVTNLGGVGDEMNLQIAKKTREFVRDLEKVAIRGVTLGNTVGSASAYRTMDGLRKRITTNVRSIGTLTESWLGNLTQDCWDQGGVDSTLIVCGAAAKRQIDSFNTATRRQTNTDRGLVVIVDVYENAFGTFRTLLSRWMPSPEVIVTSPRRVRMTNLQGRSTQYQPVGKTGDSDKGMVLGEYTLEVLNEEGMSRGY